jgi:eukaryotic-like serine/threonine-protein kinase
MPLSAGSKLGPYEILSLLGAGGMGEVYRARDPRLGRDVAIKISAARFSERFAREARAVAALNHPNICHLYDVGPDYIVMELIEGEMLSGPLSLELASDYARQLAEALEAAHEKGIVHRDLKPANIKITPEGKVKVLDFGLAKAVEEDIPSGSTQDSPTLTLSATRAGMILGTAAYMSPEQARGKPADRRADIWAFGVVFYEMLTGKALFTGETVGDILASVIKEEAKMAGIPAAARPLLERCLTKDPRRRLQSIGEARIALEDGLRIPASLPAAPVGSRSLAVPWLFAAVSLICAAVFALLYFRAASPATASFEYTVLPPESSAIHSFAVSPDGRSLAIAAVTGGKRMLWVRKLESLQARALAGTEEGAFPFWSPDSRFIAFSVQRHLKKISVSGGPAQAISDPFGQLNPYPGAWNRDGVILFATLLRAPAGGGTASRLLNAGIGMYPAFLADGTRFLYDAHSGPQEKQGIFVGSLDGKETHRILADTSNMAYARPRDRNPHGHILFVRDGTLMAQPVNPSLLLAVGDPFPVGEHVAPGPNVAYWQFSLSEAGVLAYETGRGAGEGQLTWFDRSGRQLGPAGEADRIFAFALSPDDKRVVISRTDAQWKTGNLWMRDLERMTEIRITTVASMNGDPVWSPDSGRIVFSSNRSGNTRLYRKLTSGSSPEELLLPERSQAGHYAQDWSADGKWVLFRNVQGDLLTVPSNGATEPVMLLHSEFVNSQPQLSADGRWLSYVSDESGRDEIYVQPFSNGRVGPEKWRISSTGGTNPRWRRDGKELFYLSSEGKLMSVAVKTGAAFATDSAQVLFEIPRLPFVSRLGTGAFRYAVSRDGKRFLILIGTSQTVQPPLTVVTNWQAAAKR